MKNTKAEDPINPVIGLGDTNFKGLTKREYFASEAMSGYLVNRLANDNSDRSKIAKWSVQMADELIKELNNNQ